MPADTTPTLRTMVAALETIPATALFDGLGYRGFMVDLTDTDDRRRCACKGTWWSLNNGTERRCYRDPAERVGRWLAGQARNVAPAEVLDLIPPYLLEQSGGGKP